MGMERVDALAALPAAGKSRGSWWPLARRVLTLLFLGVVAALLYRHGRDVDWPAVRTALLAVAPSTLVVAAGLAATSHALYTTYDLIGRHLTRHALPVRRVMSVAWISYVFNLNFGAIVGGVGFRLRLYSRLGLHAGLIGQVYASSVLSNWLGYLVLAGIAFLAWPLELPPDWALSSHALYVAGGVLPAIALAYLIACWCSPWRSLKFRKHRLELPSGRVALLQLALSTTNWAVMAGILYLLLGQRIDYPAVLGVMLIAAVAGAISHVPAGLGVLEAVFISLLGHRVPAVEMLAALLAYRAIYYLAPLVPALGLYAAVEAGLRRPAPGANPVETG